MSINQPRLIQTFLLDGTLEGVRIVECESTVKAFVVPRLKLADVKNREELSWPALYFLISSGDNKAYVGESENFYNRIKNHDQNKPWWNIAVAIVSTTNGLEKSDVKYLESLAVERAQGGSVTVENKTAPIRNNIHEFKLHKLQQILDDTQLILTSLGYDILSVPEQKVEQVWYCRTKKTDAKAIFRGDQFIILEDSKIDINATETWIKSYPAAYKERNDILASQMGGVAIDDTVILTKDVAFRSPNTAGGFAAGRNVNAWTVWKNEQGQTMDEVMRKVE